MLKYNFLIFFLLMRTSFVSPSMENFFPTIAEWKNEDLLLSEVPTDMDLLQVFEALKKKLDVPHDVSLRIVDTEAPEIIQRIGSGQAGYYAYYSKILYLSKKYKSLDILYVVMALAHDLEHARQFAKCPGSYHGNDPKLRETGADAAVAGYIECPCCLKKIASDLNHGDKNKGYFCYDDYEPYIKRAQEAKLFCKAHASSNLFKDFKYIDFLPQKN